MRIRPLPLMAIALVVGACVTQLPDQDLRILAAQPAAKLSAADLWKDFQRDARAAKSTYFGKAIDISDKPTAIEGQLISFGQANERGVRARLLDERAVETLKDIKVGARLTLRCYCEGLDAKQDVVLKSCIRP